MSQYLCPECGNDTKVMETRPSYNRLRRRRACVNNNHKFSTIEVPLDSPTKIIDLVIFALANAEDMGDDMIEYVKTTTLEILHGVPPEPEPKEDEPTSNIGKITYDSICENNC